MTGTASQVEGAARTAALRALFDPAAVAIVGASEDERKYGNWIAVQGLSMSGDRPVYLVNRHGRPVLGHPTYPRLSDVPDSPDLVVIAVPGSGFEQAVDDALASGARAIVGITAGFAEAGKEGGRRQAALVKRVRDAGAVLLGPNCLGVFDSTVGLHLASNQLPAGDVGLVSQSGNLALELSGLLEQLGLGFSRFASLGNQADLSLTELVRAYAHHEGTRLIAVYAEDFGDGRAFAHAAAEATAVGKPVVLLSVGAGQAASRGARSHTGALTSGTSAVGAACAATVAERVATPREMAHMLAALHPLRMPGGRRVAVLADGGGHGAIAADVAETAGLHVPEFSADLSARVRAELPLPSGAANPVDLAGAESDIGSYARTLGVLLDDPAVDQVLITGYFGAYDEYGTDIGEHEAETARIMGEAVAASNKPVAVHTVRPQSPTARLLRRHDVPVFEGIEEAAHTLARLARRAEQQPPAVPDLPQARSPLASDGYWATRELLAATVPFPDASRVSTREEALAAAEQIGYPVVLKALGLVHKSDAGGVAAGLADGADLATAYERMAARLAAPGYTVEANVDTADAVDLIVGVTRDPRFGPVAMVGLGGIFTEVLRDVAFGLAPLSPAEAERLLSTLRGAPLLTGTRGRPSCDLVAAAGAISAISEVAAAHPELVELEVNPLLARPNGALALDARAVLMPTNPHAD